MKEHQEELSAEQQALKTSSWTPTLWDQLTLQFSPCPTTARAPVPQPLLVQSSSPPSLSQIDFSKTFIGYKTILLKFSYKYQFIISL